MKYYNIKDDTDSFIIDNYDGFYFIKDGKTYSSIGYWSNKHTKTVKFYLV